MSERKRTFERSYVHPDARNIWIDRRKWSSFQNFLEEAKGNADTIVIAAPEVLGDTWREFVMNLSALGDAGLKLEILPSSLRGESTVDLTLNAFGDREVIRERYNGPMLANTSPKRVLPDMKTGLSLMMEGRKPFIILQSIGPDQVYCQADLLLRKEKERFKPSSQGRAIIGVWILGRGTLDEFLHDFPNPDLEAIERFRLEILRRGWDSFVISSEDARPYLKEIKREDL